MCTVAQAGAKISENILWYFREMMQKFLAEKDLIPPKNLLEIRFEQFEADPLAELRRVYDTWELPGYAEAEADFQNHLASLADYRKNWYHLDDDMLAKVDEHWKFAVECWGYQRPKVEADYSESQQL